MIMVLLRVRVIVMVMVIVRVIVMVRVRVIVRVIVMVRVRVRIMVIVRVRFGCEFTSCCPLYISDYGKGQFTAVHLCLLTG